MIIAQRWLDGDRPSDIAFSCCFVWWSFRHELET